MGGFVNDPMAFFREPRRRQAIDDLGRYLAGYTGAKFEHFADGNNANRVTERDLLAVSMLGVTVPARAAIDYLETRQAAIAERLEEIPTDHDALWTGDHLVEDGPAWKLFYLLRDQHQVGRTKASKLMAAKRPHLVPVFDSVIAEGLGIGKKDDDWAAWSSTLADPSIRNEVEGLRGEVDGAGHLSLLRTLDIVIWMATKRGTRG